LVTLFGNSSGSKVLSKGKISKMKTKIFDVLRKSSKYFGKPLKEEELEAAQEETKGEISLLKTN